MNTNTSTFTEGMETQKSKIFSVNYCVTIRDTVEIMNNLGLSLDNFKDQDVLLIGDGIWGELTEKALEGGARSVTIVDPTYGFSSGNWFAFYGNIFTGVSNPKALTYYIIEEEPYFRPEDNDPQKEQKNELFIDVNKINLERRQRIKDLETKYGIPVKIISAHLPQESDKLLELPPVTLIIDHFAANYYAKDKQAALRELYMHLLSKTQESKALLFPDKANIDRLVTLTH